MQDVCPMYLVELYFPVCDLPEELLGYLLSTISSHVDGKREISCFHEETATGNREKWRENRGHVVIFAVRVSRIGDAKSL